MHVDFLIIGQGLAGSALALELLRAGKRVLVIDRGDQASSSRVAAGLITPLTGKGMNPSWRQRECLNVATIFYRQLEKKFKIRLLYSTPAVRLFYADKEWAKWQACAAGRSDWAQQLINPPPAIRQPLGACEMPLGAWLDTREFLKQARCLLEEKKAFLAADFSEEDLEISEQKVIWQGIHAKQIIFCQGAYGLKGVFGYEGMFSAIPHRSAKGEILTVQLNGLDEANRYHAGKWLAPIGDRQWKLGATYEWNQLDTNPTEAGKGELLDALSNLLAEELDVSLLNHEAGIRPIVRNSRPVVGMHPDTNRVGFFNGLGSKGVMVAPLVAKHFAEVLCGKSELDAELDVRSVLPSS